MKHIKLQTEAFDQLWEVSHQLCRRQSELLNQLKESIRQQHQNWPQNYPRQEVESLYQNAHLLSDARPSISIGCSADLGVSHPSSGINNNPMTGEPVLSSISSRTVSSFIPASHTFGSSMTASHTRSSVLPFFSMSSSAEALKDLSHETEKPNEVRLAPPISRVPVMAGVGEIDAKTSDMQAPVSCTTPPLSHIPSSAGTEELKTLAERGVHICPCCGVFKNISDLIISSTTPCCGTILQSRWGLVRHQRRKHVGIRPYVCQVEDCKKTFFEAHTLKRHHRVHTGEKPFQCTFPGCTRSISDASNYRRHKLVHQGVKPYKCAICEKTFSRGLTLRKHLNRAHSSIPHTPTAINNNLI